MNTLSGFMDLVNRYNSLTTIRIGGRYDERARHMHEAFHLIAAGRRDSAADLIGEYGFLWEIIEDLLRDIDAAGFRVDALVS